MRERVSLLCFAQAAPPILDRSELETGSRAEKKRAVCLRDALAHPAAESFRWTRGAKVLCLTLLA